MPSAQNVRCFHDVTEVREEEDAEEDAEDARLDRGEDDSDA